MLKALLLNDNYKGFEQLEDKIIKYCPQVQIKGKTNCVQEAHEMLESELPNLLFLNTNRSEKKIFDFLSNLPSNDLESIIITDVDGAANGILKYDISSYLLKPVKREDLLIAVKNAHNRILWKEEYRKNRALIQKILGQHPLTDLIGVPTLEGFDFIRSNRIIRCEGMQKCTLVILENDGKIVSSYNLGEFRKILEPIGFFSPHKSHLINLNHIRKYRKDGTILMTDCMNVPVSRRRRTHFLQAVCHI